MINTQLSELNFHKLVQYSSAPGPDSRGSGAVNCTGFCVSCEKKGLLRDSDFRLDQMSHGADTDDFVKSIGSPLPQVRVRASVVFLLESPGGYYENGTPIEHDGIVKQPPVNNYYWTPPLKQRYWPTSPDQIDGSYGPYFSYILAKHGLGNAYFTNIVKCSLAERSKDKFVRYNPKRRNPNDRDAKILANCYESFLAEELRILKPAIVFYFGRRAEFFGYCAEIRSILSGAEVRTLFHPAARHGLAKTIMYNDSCLSEALLKWQTE